METALESVCCREMEAAVKQQERGCLTTHKKFRKICLDADVLQVTYLELSTTSQLAKEKKLEDVHKKYRYMAYRLFTWWLWQRLGSHRTVLPACVVVKIRSTFPSATHTGFKYPPL
ncbi:P2X purinoceptor 7-like [Ornithodoros turicata]|uniref:P2X purinoceptor 7-like n=1 Tax=Ornithodoros turicata TaxID=34597 RepID=UPI00313995B2